MLGQNTLVNSSRSPSTGRVFVYEVQGLRPTEETDYSIRQSGSVFFKVPYTRMNAEMRRILKLGGKIINIRPLEAEA